MFPASNNLTTIREWEMKQGKLVVIAGLAGVLAAGGYTIATGMSRTAAPESRVLEVQIQEVGGQLRFMPADLDVRRGDVVRFVQQGAMPHNVQFVRNSAPEGVDIGDLWTGPYLTKPNEVYEVHIDERFADGSYEYVCTPHIAMGMKGAITVSGGTPAAAGASANAAEALPEVRGVQGLQPLAYEMDGGTKVFRLTAERIRWETKEGGLVDAMAYNRMIPGPVIRVTEGDRVRIIVTNGMNEPHTTHWHGLFVPNNMDGVPGISQDPILPGESFAYEFTAKPHGTRLYHSHFNAMKQEGAGLYGMFVIEEKNPPAARQADREEIMLLGDGTLGFVINGKEFPMIEPIHMKMGERVRVRMANLGGMYHPMHMHGGFMTVIAKDGFPLPSPQQINTISIAPGETWDVILHPQYPGTWIWHCHVLSHATGPKDADGNETAAGMIGVIQVDDGKVELPDIREHRNH
jgi:manganese oxidase